MTKQRRELMFKVMDNYAVDHFVTHTMYQLDKLKRCDEVLAWLVRYKKTGSEFKDFIIHEFKGSWFQMAKWVLSRIDRDLETRRTLSGKEFSKIQS
jgi:hypothetical protein